MNGKINLLEMACSRMWERRVEQDAERAQSAAPMHGPVALITSPHAGSVNGRMAPAEALTRAGITVGEEIAVSELDDEQLQGARWRKAGYVAAVAAGGDGTVGAVATHAAAGNLPLGILPYGTANDVARALLLPMDGRVAAEVIARGYSVPVDAGQALPALTAPGAFGVAEAETSKSSGTGAHRSGVREQMRELAQTMKHVFGRGDRNAAVDGPKPQRGVYFLHALTLGLNVEFARLATDVARRERFGPLTYAASALEAVRTLRPLPVTLRLLDGAGATHTVSCHAAQIAVVNLPVFGGALELRLPAVRADDRLLDIVVIEALEPTRLQQTVEQALAALNRLSEQFRRFGAATSLAAAELAQETQAQAQTEVAIEEALALPGIYRYKAQAVILETPDAMDVTLDGEIRAHTPTLARVAPQPLRIFAPTPMSGPVNDPGNGRT